MNVRGNQSGFSLIELMIVVAIIGILATVAIPNFSRFQAKARQSEAKTLLSGIYTAEKAFHAEWTNYTADLVNAGFDVNIVRSRYTDIGFSGTNALTVTPPNYPAEVAANLVMVGGTAANLDATCDGRDATGQLFLACAEAQLDQDATLDAWEINQNRTLRLFGGLPANDDVIN